MTKAIWLTALVLALSAMTSTRVQAQSSADDKLNSVGFHLGINFEGDEDLLLGFESRFRLMELGKLVSWSINPTFSLYVDSWLDFSIDVTTPFDFHVHHIVVPYVAPGIGIKDGRRNAELAFDVVLGTMFVIPDTFVVPFSQFRIYVGDYDGFELMGGIHFDLF